MKKYQVAITRTEHQRAEIEVEAEDDATREEVEEQANDEVSSDDFDIMNAYQEVESVKEVVEDTEPLEPKPLKSSGLR